MNVDAISNQLKRFFRKHRQTFYEISTNQSKALELSVTVAVVEHYRSLNYSIKIENPRKAPHQFTVKTSTRGYPWNFTRIYIERNNRVFELHMNLTVRGAHDLGKYCVDVGLVREGVVPLNKSKTKWDCVDNDDLITFAEVKKLVIYPMLLAQFIGIVHEIKPEFLSGRLPYGFKRDDHLIPTLASLGNYSGNSLKIVENYARRKINIRIAENFDVRIANLRGGRYNTPFYDY